MERDAVERYARHVLDDVFDGDPSRVRAGLVAIFSHAYGRAHGTDPSDEEFVEFLADRYAAATAPDPDGYTPDDHIEADEKLDAARRNGPVCTGCLGMVDYPRWVGAGAPVRDGRPLMETDVTVRPHEMTAPAPRRVSPDKAHAVEVTYRCPADAHDTGFTEYHVMSDDEFAAFRDGAADRASSLRDRLDLDEE